MKDSTKEAIKNESEKLKQLSQRYYDAVSIKTSPSSSYKDALWADAEIKEIIEKIDETEKRIDRLRNGLIYQRALFSGDIRDEEEYNELDFQIKEIQNEIKGLERLLEISEHIDANIFRSSEKDRINELIANKKKLLKEFKKRLNQVGQGRVVQGAKAPGKTIKKGFDSVDKRFASPETKSEIDTLQQAIDDLAQKQITYEQEKKKSEEEAKKHEQAFEEKTKQKNEEVYSGAWSRKSQRERDRIEREIKAHKDANEYYQQQKQKLEDAQNSLKEELEQKQEELNNKRGYIGTAAEPAGRGAKAGISKGWDGAKQGTKSLASKGWDSLPHINPRKAHGQAEEKTIRAGFIFIVLALILHIIKYGLQFNYSVTWMLDVVFAFIVFYFIFSHRERETRGFKPILIILFLETLFPLALSYLDTIAENQFVHYYLANRLLTPWWFYYAVIRGTDCENPHPLATASKVFVFIFWIGVLFSVPAISIERIDTDEFMTYQQTETLVDFGERFWDFWWDGVATTIGEGLWQVPASLYESFRGGMDYATGGYYTGMVDRHEEQNLGVFFEEVEPTSSYFHHESPVSVYGRIDVYSIDDAVKLNLSCHHEGRDACEMYPEESRWYYRNEQEQIDCTFTERRLSPGNQEITMEAGFNFETMAYQKAYFMDRETKRSLIAEGKDPLREYEIRDDDPDTIHTAGPVMIGMEITGEQPIEVEEGSSRRPTLGITVDRKRGWNGYIEELEDLVIQVPKSMDLLHDTCNYEFIKLEDDSEAIEEFIEGYRNYRSSQFRECSNQIGLRAEDFNESGYIGELRAYTEEEIEGMEEEMSSCLRSHAEEEIEGHKTYILDVEEERPELKDIKSHRTFNCRLNIEEAHEILEGSPLAIHNIRAKTRYQYKLEESTNVYIEGEKEHRPEPGSPGARMEAYEHKELAEEVAEKFNQNMDLDIEESERSLLTPCLILGLASVESSGNEDAVGDAGEKGLMQVMPNTAQGEIELLEKEDWFVEEFDSAEEILTNYDGFNREHSMIVGTFYLARMLEQRDGYNWENFDGNPRENAIKYALGHYNAGENKDFLIECQEDEESFSICGADYGKHSEYVGDDHGRDYTGKVWESKQKCLEKEFSPLDEEREDEKGEWLDESKEFTIAFSNESVHSCVEDENEALSTHNEEVEEEEDELEEINKEEIEDILDNILEETSKSIEEHMINKWGEITQELTRDDFKRRVVRCISREPKIVLKKDEEKKEEPYEVELEGTRYNVLISEDVNFWHMEETEYDEGMDLDARVVYNNSITWPVMRIKKETDYIEEMPFIKYEFDRDGREVDVKFEYLSGFSNTFEHIGVGDEFDFEFAEGCYKEIGMGLDDNEISQVAQRYPQTTEESEIPRMRLELSFYDDDKRRFFSFGEIPWGEYNPEARQQIPDIKKVVRPEDTDYDLLQKDMLKLEEPLGLYAQEIGYEGDGYYDIQLTYDPLYQARCCFSEEGPKVCEERTPLGFGLGTCNETILDDCDVQFGMHGLECD